MRRPLPFALLLSLALAPPARGQSLRDLPIWLSAEVRERYDNPELPLFKNEESNVNPYHGALPFFFSRIRLGVLAEPLPRFSAFAQIQDARVWGSEGGTLENVNGIDLHQGWLQLGDQERFVRFGRQEYALGEERLFGVDDWYETGRAYDMIRFRSPLAGGRWIGEFLYAEVTNPVPDNEDVAFELIPVTRLFSWGFARAYLAEQHDSHRGPLKDQKQYLFTLGLHGHGRFGPWEVDLEGAGQAGHDFDDNQRAAAVAGYVRRRFEGEHPFTLGFEFSRASGDGDDGDGIARDFDPLYPSRHDRYGFLDLLSLVNQRQLGLAFDMEGGRPGDRVHLALRNLSLENPKGRWINARGETVARDRTGTSGRHIGVEIDLQLVRRVFREIDLYVSLAGGYMRGGHYGRTVANIVQAYEGTITFTYRVGRVPGGAYR